MRLLWLDDYGKLRLAAELSSNKIPPYAILSQTWGPDGDEVVLQDLASDSANGNFCADQAQRDGLLHFWVDTFCIDRTNSAELSEAINSMFCWYREAARCYVYLSDVTSPQTEPLGLHRSLPGGFDALCPALLAVCLVSTCMLTNPLIVIEPS